MAEADGGKGVVATAVKRLVALIALVAVAGAVWAIASNSDTAERGDSESDAKAVAVKEGEETPVEYVIAEGDTVSGIAERFGISVERIERLNPDLATHTLATGDTVILLDR